jgi:hypothetical protein
MSKKHAIELKMQNAKVDKDSISKPFHKGVYLITFAAVFNNTKVLKKIIKIDEFNYKYMDQNILSGMVNTFKHDNIIKLIKLFTNKGQKFIFNSKSQAVAWILPFIETATKNQLEKFMEFPLDYLMVYDNKYILGSYIAGVSKHEHIDIKLLENVLRLSKPFIKKYEDIISPMADVCIYYYNSIICTAYLKIYPNALSEYNISSDTPLTFALSENHMEFFDFALSYMRAHKKHDYNFFASKAVLTTALCTLNEYAVSELLKFPKLDLSVHNLNKMTPAHLVLSANNTMNQTIKHNILKRTKNINAVNLNGVTVLHMICMSETLGIYESILETKICDPYIKDKLGKTPIHYCTNLHLLASIVTKGFINNSRKTQVNNKCLPKLAKMGMYDKIYKCIRNEFDKVLKNTYKFEEKNRIDFIEETYKPVPIFTNMDPDAYIYLLYFVDKYDVKLFSNKATLSIKCTEPRCNVFQENFKKYKSIVASEIVWYDVNSNITIAKFDEQIANIKNEIYFVYFTVLTDNYTHQNGLIFNGKKKMGIRFEPHGNKTKGDVEVFDAKMEQICKKKGWTYHKPSSYIEGSSYQTLSQESNIDEIQPGDPGGFCLAWTLWFLELYIRNPDVELKDLVTTSVERIIYTKQSFKSYIRAYSNKLAQHKVKYLTKLRYPATKIFNLNYSDEDSDNVLSLINNSYKTIV